MTELLLLFLYLIFLGFIFLIKWLITSLYKNWIKPGKIVKQLTELARNGSQDAVTKLVEILITTDNKTQRRMAFDGLGKLTNQDAINLIYQKWAQNREPLLEELILHFDQLGTLSQSYQKALLYFLTQQWEKYETLDFDYKLLQTAHELADESLRQKIGETIRKVGRVELIQILTGGRKGKKISQMSLTDWDTTLAIFSSKQEWQQIWQLAQKAPAITSRQFLQQLKQVNWQSQGEEREEFHKLVYLSAQCREKSFQLGSMVDCQTTLTEHTNSVNCLAMSQDGTLLASGGGYKTVRLWRLPEGRLLSTLDGHTADVSGLAMSQDGTLLASSGSRDKTVRLWGLPEGQLLSTLDGHTWAVNGLAMSQDGTLLASRSYDKTVRLWRLPEGQPLATLRHIDYVECLAMSQDGRILASGSSDKTVKLWRLPKGQYLTTLTGHTNSVNCLAMSKDGTLLASGSDDNTVKLWRLPEGRLLATLTGHTSYVNRLAMSQDGRILASGSGDNTVRLWKLPEGQLLSTLDGHTWAVNGLAMSQDGTLLASSGSYNNTVRLWRLPEGQLLATLTETSGPLVISQDGTLLASGSYDNTVKLWRSSLFSLSRLPIDAIKLEQINQIQSQLKAGNCTQEERNWLEFILELVNLNRRFDIEVAEGESVIEVGEFDIEI